MAGTSILAKYPAWLLRLLSLPDMFSLVAGVSRRKLCVVFDPYPLGRVGGRGGRGAAGNRGAHVLNSGLPTVRRKLHQRLWLHPKRAVPTQRRTVSRGLVSLYAGQSGVHWARWLSWSPSSAPYWWRARTGTRPSPSLSWRERCPSWSRPGRRGWSCSAAICRSACSPWDGSCWGGSAADLYVSARLVVLLMVGSVLAFFPFPFTAIPFGLAVAWIGLSLLSGRGTPAEQPARVQ